MQMKFRGAWDACAAPTALGSFTPTCTQGFRPGLGMCRAYGAAYVAALLAVFGELVVEEIG